MVVIKCNLYTDNKDLQSMLLKEANKGVVLSPICCDLIEVSEDNEINNTMKCIQCSHRGVCKYVEEDFRNLEKEEQWASQKIEIMEEKDACDLFELDEE